jgi:prophage antirepressor-like protein
MQDLIRFENNHVTFDFETKPGQKIKIVGTFDDPYFCGKDVCTILEYKDVKDALQNHVKPKYKKDLKTIVDELEGVSPSNSITTISSIEPSYHAGKAVYINEPGLYALIMKSRTSFAETFQDFVYEQILPSIRKRGRFQLEQQLAVKDDKIDKLTALVKQMDIRTQELLARTGEIVDQNNELLENVQDLKDQNDELLDTTGQQTVQIETIQHKLGISVKDRAALPKQKSKQERFVLIKRTQKRNGIEPEYTYYTIRAQDSRVKLSLRTQEAMYNIEILLDLTCHPNSKTFYNRIKEDLIEKGVQFSYNNISIENSEIDEDVLITLMKKINDEKLNV